jgi:NADPH:quinone reductase-like Zn-dependent oxidoreductase
MRKRASIHGVFLSLASVAEMTEMHAAIGASLVRGTLKIHVGTVLPLESAPEAHKLIINPSEGANGKIVLHPW